MVAELEDPKGEGQTLGEKGELFVGFSLSLFVSHGECDSNESSCDAWTTG